jgi:hypothetical protein
MAKAQLIQNGLNIGAKKNSSGTTSIPNDAPSKRPTALIPTAQINHPLTNIARGQLFPTPQHTTKTPSSPSRHIHA